MDAGGLPVFSSANQAHQINNNLHLQQQQQQRHQLDHLQQQNIVGQDHSQYHSTESIPPKRVDRFRRRIENYRRRQTDCEPRFEQTFSGVCEQQNIETTVLQKRFLESKAKRAAKKTDKKPDTTLAGNLQSSVLVVSPILFLIFFIHFLFKLFWMLNQFLTDSIFLHECSEIRSVLFLLRPKGLFIVEPNDNFARHIGSKCLNLLYFCSLTYFYYERSMKNAHAPRMFQK